MDKQSLKEQFESLKEKAFGYWEGLEPRTRTLYVLFAFALIFSLTVNVLIRPQGQKIRQAKQELASLNNRAFELTAQIPDVENEKFLLEKEKKSLEVLKSELELLESQLPQQDSLPTLLGELVKETSGYVVDFNLIKPVDKPKKDDYERLDIQLKFGTNYAGLVNYLKRLEQISRFISTESISVVEKKGGSPMNLEVALVLSTLLSEGSGSVSKVYRSAKVLQVQPFDLKRNPFYSSANTNSGNNIAANYTLSGIISEGPQPTAIINDEVYKIGDMIGQTIVKEIVGNSVILQEGPLDITLTLSQE